MQAIESYVKERRKAYNHDNIAVMLFERFEGYNHAAKQTTHLIGWSSIQFTVAHENTLFI